ncbi:endonuclease G, mitochondrial-like [Biomphalaria glabrata]|uniref:Endonuclease n=1 Tax=Biomphalaria glabrata TaxID=6526 RepID=A0A2C9JIU1_BIOGL|nr:endonuclease G, mitochondrial-like [Biomphalaria glabrata]KAI8778806.1 endonuclease G, mitochondrial [Biomphalaria glabrata]
MLIRHVSTVITSCCAGVYIGYKYKENVASVKHYFLSNIYAKSAPPSTNDSLVNSENNVNIPFQSESSKSKVVSNAGQIVKYGFPSTDNLRSYEDFMLSYDRRTRTASWVLEHLTPEKVNRVDGVERSKLKFLEDESIHGYHRATNKDYLGSGYDRGHLAAAANHRQSLNAMSQTFLLSNIAPQVGAGFNRDSWNSLEKYVRALARKNKNVYVCTGPLFLPRKEADGKLYVRYEVIGENHVAVPTHFFKVLVVENSQGQFELQSYVMPNQPLPEVRLQNYLVPLEVIERAAGLLFFQNIPKKMFTKINARQTP